MPHFNDVIAHRRVSASSYSRLGQLLATLNPLTYAATVTPDLDKGDLIDLTLTGNLTVAAPTGGQTGRLYTFVLRQDGAGAHTVTFNSAFKLAGGAFTLSAGASEYDSISFMFDGTNYLEVSRAQDLG